MGGVGILFTQPKAGWGPVIYTDEVANFLPRTEIYILNRSNNLVPRKSNIPIIVDLLWLALGAPSGQYGTTCLFCKPGLRPEIYLPCLL